mgnify:CR=1 FL=1
MFLERRPDGGLVFNDRWDRFSVSWRQATDAERVVLEDGRPAIRREPLPDETDGEVTFTTLAPELWERIKSRQREAFALAPPPPRTRWCQACRAAMVVSREYDVVWCFRCPTCGSSETWGKDVLGGTRGAGETEKR